MFKDRSDLLRNHIRSISTQNRITEYCFTIKLNNFTTFLLLRTPISLFTYTCVSVSVTVSTCVCVCVCWWVRVFGWTPQCERSQSYLKHPAYRLLLCIFISSKMNLEFFSFYPFLSRSNDSKLEFCVLEDGAICYLRKFKIENQSNQLTKGSIGVGKKRKKERGITSQLFSHFHAKHRLELNPESHIIPPHSLP